MKFRSKIIFVLAFLFMSSCTSHKTLFTEELDDGSKVHGSTAYHKGVEGRYYIVIRDNSKKKIHNEYFIDRFTCDTITKKIFQKKKVEVLWLTAESKVDYPITPEDRVVFDRIMRFLPSNHCLRNYVNEVRGYKIYYRKR